MKRLTLSLFLYLLLSSSTFSMEELPQKVRIGNSFAFLEIADELNEIQTGLSYRQEMDWDRGMLFCFSVPEKHGFWMRHCYFDIDLAYLDSNGVIRQIIFMKAEPLGTPDSQLKVYSSESNEIQYVIEMNAGWFEANQVQVGDTADVKRFRSKFDKSFYQKLFSPKKKK